jgi:uncharacterized protein
MDELGHSNPQGPIWEKHLGVTWDEIPKFCQRWGILELSLFGSILRPDFRPDSDVDVLITFRTDAHWSLLEWVQMRDELQKLLGRRVDLVKKQAIRNPFRRKSILNTQRVIYAA